MQNIQTRISTLSEVFSHWLSDENEHLLRAVRQTASEGYFSFSDVQYALKALRHSLSLESLKEWVNRSGITADSDARGRNVMCLHAGNLPLVGFQDALAVLISGARYTGKISRKDPYLLPTFLNEVKQTEVWGGENVQWSHRLNDFEGMQNDAILFAGSGQSVPKVTKAIGRLNLQSPDTRFLIRTAHFSMALLKNKDEEVLQDLTEAMLRYGGKGCRSSAVVVSPFALDEVRNDIKPRAEAFLQENPQHAEPQPKLGQRRAYNEAVERSQLWLDHFLVQEGGLEMDQDFICYWVQGDEKEVAALADQFGDRLQSVYTTAGNNTSVAKLNQKTELLATAQRPPIYWQPDGKDSLEWLCR
jgi:hypothetical protein